jgi:hypothetical protein
MTKQVRILINRVGEMSVKTEGYEGVSCQDASKIFETLGTVTSDKPTTEMYDKNQIQGIEVAGGI